MDQVWANRAASAEAAVATRHLKKLWGLPGTQLGVVAWPPTEKDRRFGTWHYWWQAHLLDCLVDAQVRDPQPERRRASIARQIRGHRLRNNGSWINNYYDDMAWLALALERAGRLAGVERSRRAATSSSEQFVNAWVPEDGGGIPWRKQDQFFNAPANGPAGIFLARYGDRLRRAQQMADWIDETLIDPETHLVFDGIKAGSLVRAQYTYCQGVVVGPGDRTRRPHRRRAARRSGCTGWSPRSRADGARGRAQGRRRRRRRPVRRRHRALPRAGGDRAARGHAEDVRGPRRPPRKVVLKSAQSAWDYRQTVDGLPLFGPFWDRTAEMPGGAGGKEAQFVEGAVNSLGGPRARSVGAACRAGC